MKCALCNRELRTPKMRLIEATAKRLGLVVSYGEYVCEGFKIAISDLDFTLETCAKESGLSVKKVKA